MATSSASLLAVVEGLAVRLREGRLLSQIASLILLAQQSPVTGKFIRTLVSLSTPQQPCIRSECLCQGGLRRDPVPQPDVPKWKCANVTVIRHLVAGLGLDSITQRCSVPSTHTPAHEYSAAGHHVVPCLPLTTPLSWNEILSPHHHPTSES